jgi:uncharacterized protein involved in exopolysaccharide biosynthesis
MDESAKETEYIDQNDEVELIDLIQVLGRRKKLIIGGTLLCMLLTGIVGFALPPVYRFSTIIEIGTIEKVGRDGVQQSVLIENPASLLEKIQGKVYDEIIREKLGLKESQYPEIRTKNPKKTPLLEISIESPDKQNALKVLRHLDELIVRDHTEVIAVRRFDLQNSVLENRNAIALIEKDEASTKEQLVMNKKQKEQLQKQIEDVQERIAELERQKALMDSKAGPHSALSLLLLSNEIREDQRYYNDLQDRLHFGLERNASAVRDKLNSLANRKQSFLLNNEKLAVHLDAFRDTRIVKKPSNSEKPVKPKKGLNLVLSGLAGLMGFVFLAFFLEYLQGAKAARGEVDPAA